MKSRFLTTLALAGAVAVPVATSAAGASAATAPAAHPAATKTIVGVAASDPRFSTLVKLVKSAGLTATLSKGSYTVFAPTNAAFAKVPKKTLTALGKDKAKLRAVLLYHVVKGRLPASKLDKLTSVKTLNGASIKITVKSGKVYLNGTTRVTKANIKASNGVIHAIDKVLLPPA
ncbi:MAG TPA: fasciclin domain-containing protein [Baekduia sp.]|uniref:fasciclin domain-containing protein n=1 Tax=Baekduia sp. TaxID=2600305 RepID=UPI002D791AF1|nr:fasciclin domain-containing protein [Baekduia sp.]HET6509145.1 fasciclin domain-containing protein [Baekduia sp.]